MRIDIIAGARPNFMKIAPIIRAIETNAQGKLAYRLIHTGQHYDRLMSQTFFEELNIPEPTVNLGAGGGTQAEQTAAIMVGYEKLLMTDTEPSQLCMVVGDVTSTMACSIVAKKMGLKVAHVEGGIRSNDWAMPEEINRVVTDSITDYFYITSDFAERNLLASGVPQERIVFVGNTMIDTLLANKARFQQPDFFASNELKPKKYVVVTLHRPSNVDEPQQLKRLLTELNKLADEQARVVFPIHPRTRKKLADMPEITLSENIILADPQPYLSFNYLVANSLAVVTDSGGITEECTVLGVPCLTLRTTTERPETVTIGTNELLGNDVEKVHGIIRDIKAGNWKKGGIPPLWDGRTAERIVDHLLTLHA